MSVIVPMQRNKSKESECTACKYQKPENSGGMVYIGLHSCGEWKRERCEMGCGRYWDEEGDFDDCVSAYHIGFKPPNE